MLGETGGGDPVSAEALLEFPGNEKLLSALGEWLFYSFSSVVHGRTDEEGFWAPDYGKMREREKAFAHLKAHVECAAKFDAFFTEGKPVRYESVHLAPLREIQEYEEIRAIFAREE